MVIQLNSSKTDDLITMDRDMSCFPSFLNIGSPVSEKMTQLCLLENQRLHQMLFIPHSVPCVAFNKAMFNTLLLLLTSATF